MHARERHLAVLMGQEPDRVDIVIAEGLRKGPTGGLLRRLSARGVGITHLVPPYRPNFLYDFSINPELEEVVYSKTFYIEGGVNKCRHTFDTPIGSIWSVTGEHRNNEVQTSSPIIPFIKSKADWSVLNYIFREMANHIRPNYKEMELDQEDLGESGFTIAVLDKTPFQRAWIEVASLEEAISGAMDETEEFLGFVDIQKEIHKKAAEIAAGCPSPHVLLIDNITNIISPKLYQKYCQPFYKIYSDCFRGTNKKLAIHFDGLFRHLINVMRDSTFDIIDSFTVPPTGNVSIAEVKRLLPDKQIFVNLPPHLAFSDPTELRKGYSRIVDDWGSKVLTIEHVEDMPPETLESHFMAALDVCGYPG
jgi:hypothetical protein